MMKFTLGIAILVFTLIVGSYEYFDNEELISAKQRGLAEAKAKQQRFERIENRSKQISNFAIPRGEDKKNTIERQLGIGEPGLKFSFIGQARRETAHLGIIRHTFKIEGPATFAQAIKVLNDLHDRPGYVIYDTCFNCSFAKRDLPQNQHLIKIEGYLYAYDPNIL